MTASLTPHILICDPIHADGVDLLRQVGKVTVLEQKLSPDQLIDAAQNTQALVVRSRTHITADMMQALPHLQVIARAGAGLDNIDVSTARARGIQVVNSPDANTLAVAEHTLGLLLSLARHIPAADASMKAGRWDKKKLMGTSLTGKTLGIIGFGRIGREVARRAAAFGMHIIVNQPRLTPELALSEGAVPHDLYDLLAQADFVTVHVPMRPQNLDLIGSPELAAMKPSAYLINTARGGIVNEEALLTALNAAEITGAAVDVFAQEPTSNIALVSHPRVIATPHIGASTQEAQRDAALIVAEQISELLSGGQQSAGSLNLRVVNLDEVVTHESVDPKRVQRLQERFEDSGTLSDPPVVSFWDGKYVVLDGATRTNTLQAMNYGHIIVQVVSPDREVTLHTWSHAVSNLDFDAFLAACTHVSHLQAHCVTLDKAEEHLRTGTAFAYLNHLQRGIYVLESDAPTWEERLDAVRKVVDIYNRLGEVERTLSTDMTLLQNDYPTLSMVVIFRPLDVREILQAAADGHPMPAGVTRFVIPGRVLRLNARLDTLRRSASLTQKNEWLNELLTERLARAGARYYQEPVILLDE